MDVKVGDRYRFTTKDWYCSDLRDMNGMIVTVYEHYKYKELFNISNIAGGLYVTKDTLSPINIKGEQLVFSFME